MQRVLLYSCFLILGLITSQMFYLQPFQFLISAVTMTCLAYIMIEVGLEFVIDKTRLSSYVFDYIVAGTAAAFPWIFCAWYFWFAFPPTSWEENLMVSRFAAPTSAGILFTMLASAGIAKSWVFKKVRILAIFDDLDTILFLIPLQMLFLGFTWRLFIVMPIMIFLLWLAYRFLHVVRLPTNSFCLLGYGALIVLILYAVEHAVDVHLEVLLPAFVLGCLLDHRGNRQHVPDHEALEPKKKSELWFDHLIKGVFMFLVGCSLPAIKLGSMSVGEAAWHVLMLTFLSNLGKCFPILCYRKEATLRERVALAVAMFPRGEVGAGVLLVSIEYGVDSLLTGVGALSLALNLFCTVFFIMIVLGLTKARRKAEG